MVSQCSMTCARRFCTGISSTPWLPLLRTTRFRARIKFSRERICSINIRYASFREQRFSFIQFLLHPLDVPSGIHHVLQSSKPSRVVCVQRRNCLPRCCSLLIVQPFPPVSRRDGTMASADFWLFSCPSLGRLPRVLGVPTRPPRVRTQSFPPPICFIYCMRPSAERVLPCLAGSPNRT